MDPICCRLQKKREEKLINSTDHISDDEIGFGQQIIFDVNEDSIHSLSDVIAKCVCLGSVLKPYSSATFKYPNLSLTKIPGLRNLFQQACIHHGLLGYLDWLKEIFNDENVEITINNIIIITCGTPCVHDCSSKDGSHDIDSDKLEVLRRLSRVRFEKILSSI